MGRWACFGLRGLRYRAAKGKRWSLERAGMEGRNMAFRGAEWGVWDTEWALYAVSG